MTTKAQSIPTGPGAAAMISAGIGTLTLGLMTTGAVIFVGLKDFLNFYNPAGPLSGKTSVAILAWLVSWLFLNARWKEGEYALEKAFRITMVLILIGLILTFPPVFEAFE